MKVPSPGKKEFQDDDDDDRYLQLGEGKDVVIPSASQNKRRIMRHPLLVEDFLIPHLDKTTFGNKLAWVDRKKGIFQIWWFHKNHSEWNMNDCAVFLEWDKVKRRPVTTGQHYWMEAKQRFRSALHKVAYARRVKDYFLSHPKNIKVYQIKRTADLLDMLVENVDSSSPPADPISVTYSDGESTEQTMLETTIVDPPDESMNMDVFEKYDPAETEDSLEELTQGSKRSVSRSLIPSKRKSHRDLKYKYCHLCSYRTRNKRIFYRHLLMHNNKQLFHCHYCHLQFVLPESLFLHLQVHLEQVPYKCFRCGFATRLLLQLKRHYVVRFVENMCQCSYCGVVFKRTSPFQVLQHIEVNHINKRT